MGFWGFGVLGFWGADQVIWQPDLSAPRALSAFIRVMGTPQSDRNLITFSANGGLALKAPFQGRDGDIVGLGFGYGLISGNTRGYDADVASFAAPGTLAPIRTSETFLETFYTINLATWWQITPDFNTSSIPAAGSSFRKFRASSCMMKPCSACARRSPSRRFKCLSPVQQRAASAPTANGVT